MSPVRNSTALPLLPTPRSALFLASALPGATFYVVAGGARFTRRSRSTRGNHAPIAPLHARDLKASIRSGSLPRRFLDSVRVPAASKVITSTGERAELHRRHDLVAAPAEQASDARAGFWMAQWTY